MTYTFSSAPETRVTLFEHAPKLPAGYTLGALVTRPGRSWVYVIRDEDDAAILARLSPALSECMEGEELGDALALAFEALT